MKVAVIGCGVMGRTHANAYNQLQGAELVGVCDFVEEAARKTAETFNTTPYFSFEEMVKEAKPEAISVCLPTHLHKEYVKKAADMGIHVICEKPVAPNLEDAREIIAYCESKGVRLFVAHVVRFFPSYKNISDKVKAGAVGDLGVIHTKRIGGHPGATKPWYKDVSKSGGVIMDLMIHDLDYVRSIAGDVKSVYAIGRTTDDIDYALVTLRFENGAIANLEAFWGYPGAFTTAVEVSGNKGVIRYNSEATTTLKVRKAADPGAGADAVAKNLSPHLHDPYYYELEHFLNCIASGEDSEVTAEDGYEAVKLSLAALESLRTGKAILMNGFEASERGSN